MRRSWLRAVRLIVLLAGAGVGGPAAAADCEGLPGVRCDGGGRIQSSAPSSGLKPVETLGGAFATSTEPATWGAINFRADGSRCVGLLRRGVCK
jgi:hypothetical protein